MPPEIFSSTKLHMIRDLNHFYCTSKLDISFKLFTELSFFCCRCFKLTFIHFLFFIIIDLLSTFSLFSSLNWSVMTDNWSIITLNHMTYTKWYHQQVTMYDTFQAQQCRDTAYTAYSRTSMASLNQCQCWCRFRWSNHSTYWLRLPKNPLRQLKSK